MTTTHNPLSNPWDAPDSEFGDCGHEGCTTEAVGLCCNPSCNQPCCDEHSAATPETMCHSCLGDIYRAEKFLTAKAEVAA